MAAGWDRSTAEYSKKTLTDDEIWTGHRIEWNHGHFYAGKGAGLQEADFPVGNGPAGQGFLRKLWNDHKEDEQVASGSRDTVPGERRMDTETDTGEERVCNLRL